MAAGPRLVDGDGPARGLVRPDAVAAGRAAASGGGSARRGRRGRRRRAATSTACSPTSATSTGSAARACSCARDAAVAAGLLRRAVSSCTRRTWTSARRCARRGGRILFTPAAEVVHLRGRSIAAGRRRRRDALRPQPPAFYEKHLPGWAPWLRALAAAARPAHPIESPRSACCGLPSTPASCTTTASAPTSGTCVRELARQDDDDRVRPALPSRRRRVRPQRSDRGSSRSSNASGNYSVREQVERAAGARAGARRSLSRAALRRLAADDRARTS